MRDKIIELKHVNKHYGNIHALKDVYFELYKGEILGLVGHRGCGKTTMIKIISGLTDIDEGGKVVICGRTVGVRSAKMAMECGVRVIDQNLALFPNLSVAENIAFDSFADRKTRNVNRKKILETAFRIIELLKVNINIQVLVSELSIADRQLVAIARALASNASLIIMDEPTATLTIKEAGEMFSVIKSLQKRGITFMLASHKPDEIAMVAERLSVMRDGHIIDTLQNKNINIAKISRIINEEEQVARKKTPRPRMEEVLRVESLSLGRFVRSVTLSVKKGEILGIIGPMGSGKTELASLLSGAALPETGRMSINGKEVSFSHNRDIIRSRIVYIPEERVLKSQVKVIRKDTINIIRILQEYIQKNSDSERNICSISERRVVEQGVKTAAPYVSMRIIQGAKQASQTVKSPYEKEPDVMILYKPASGLDPKNIEMLYGMIRTLSKTGISIILISDNIREIYCNCNRALAMHNGRITKELFCSGISENEFRKEVTGSNN